MDQKWGRPSASGKLRGMIVALLLAANLAADLQEIARLPGEPSVVAAAGVTAADQSIPTIENRSAFDPESPRRRLVIVGARTGDEACAAMVADLVRWLKTQAPPQLRQAWDVSAVPSPTFDPGDEASMVRWLRFQAADVVVNVTVDGGVDPAVAAAGVANALHIRAGQAGARDALEQGLRRFAQGPSSLAIRRRVARDPLAIARLLAPKYPGTPAISYIPSIAWANTLTLARLTNDASLRTKVEQQTAPWRTGDKELFGERIQLTSVAGTFVFGELGARDIVAKGIDAASKVKDGDVYEYGQGWTDDMFMATVVLARNGRAGLASRMLVAYASRLQRPDGLFNHATNGPAAWGRGNAFAALGLAEALGAASADDPNRARVLAIYRRQMDAVRGVQAPDGMWNEVLDEPGSYREESATAMLLTAMARGIRAGWLDQSFRAPVERAWRGVAAHVADDGTIVDVCTSTGVGPTRRYYLDRAAVTGADDRGGAMALMAAIEIDELRHAPAVAAQ